jgi:hypothetical protein
MVLGDAACSIVSLTFGTPADRIHIMASLALSEKCCRQHGGSIFAVRAVTRLLWSEGVKTVEIHHRMLFQYDSCLAQRIVYDWVELFRNGRKGDVD